MNLSEFNAVHYHRFIGRWSQRVAREFVAWLAISLNCRWLDVGCGTGALTGEIFVIASPRSVCCVDPSAARVRYAQRALPLAEFWVGTVQQRPADWIDFDVVVSGLALNVMADPAKELSAMIQATRPGGMVAAYCWDFGQGLQLLRYLWDTVMELDRAAIAMDPMRRYPLARPKRLQALFEAAGLHSIEMRSLEISTLFRDFEDYWLPFSQGNGKTQRYVQTLDVSMRLALRDRLQQRLPIQPNGTIPLSAKAWAIKGIRSCDWKGC